MYKKLLTLIVIFLSMSLINCAGGPGSVASTSAITSTSSTAASQTGYGYAWVYGTGANAGQASYSYVYRLGSSIGVVLSGPFAGATGFFF